MASERPPDDELGERDQRALEEALVRLNGHAWGMAFGVLAGVALFLATVVLVLRGGSTVGPHLALLGIYLRGYEVTWTGAVIGLLYGLVLGYLSGWVIGALYNRLVRL
ncbi:MAG: hypothetical protein ABI818_04545 [Acidobacteriota bacterium]